MTIEEAKVLRVELLTMTERLIAEFDGTPAGSVIAVVALCRRQLAATGVNSVGLTYATESMARTKMSKAAKPRCRTLRTRPPAPSDQQGRTTRNTSDDLTVEYPTGSGRRLSRSATSRRTSPTG